MFSPTLLWPLLLLTCTASSQVQDNDGVPWNGPQAIPDHLPPRQVGSPGELLAIYGIGSDRLNAFRDGQSVDMDERQTLIRLLFRMPQLPLHRLEAWATASPALDVLAAAPQDNRLRAVRVSGRVRQIETEEVPQSVRRGVGFRSYYRVDLETDEGVELRIFTRSVPKSWQQGPPPAAPARATALFFKRGAGLQKAPLLLVSPRLVWLPDHPDPAHGITGDHVFLAHLGMDCGLFDTVRDRNRKSIDHHDRECFYQLLAAVNRGEDHEFARQASRGFDVAPLLQHPEQHHGDLFTLDGVARRITRIVVSDEDIQQRLGIDHYYQIDLFVPLGKNQVVRLGHGAAAEESPTFVNSYPVTACVRSLPPGLRPGENLRARIRIRAAYFKLWAYRSQFVSSYDKRQLQVGPMMVGRQPLRIPRAATSNRWTGIGVAVAFLIALAGTWIWVLRWRREDARFSQRHLGHRRLSPRDKSLDDLGLITQDGPDFSGLERSAEDESQKSG